MQPTTPIPSAAAQRPVATGTGHETGPAMEFVDISGNPRIPILMEMVAALSRATDPQQVLREFARGFRKLCTPAASPPDAQRTSPTSPTAAIARQRAQHRRYDSRSGARDTAIRRRLDQRRHEPHRSKIPGVAHTHFSTRQ